MGFDPQTQIMDEHLASILICYLLHTIQQPIEKENLYHIAVESEVINFFYYADAIDFLVKNQSLKETKEDDQIIYSLTPKGEDCAKQLWEYAPKSQREKIVEAALKQNARLSKEKDIKVDYEATENGWYVHVKWCDKSEDFMDIRLYVPEKEQAVLLGEKIFQDPVRFYTHMIATAFSNEEKDFDVSKF